MILSTAHPGRWMRVFCIALAGLLVFDFALYPIVAHAQSRRRDTRQTEEKPERREPKRPFSAPSLEESEKDAPPTPVEIKSIGKAAYDAVIRSGRYIVGPGDVFAVVIDKGEEIESFEVPVGAGGNLLVPSVGPVPVAFLPLVEANRTIQAAIKKRFQHLDISISLTRLRIFPVNVVGEVHIPGAVGVHGVEQASQLILKAGGLIDDPDRRGSSRNIQITRHENGQWEHTGRRVDLALWNRTGDEQYNPFLIDGEQIVVPATNGDSISVTGAVQSPGTYEYAPGDRVSDLIVLSNGLRAHALPKRAQLLRLSKDGNWTPIAIDLLRAMAGDPSANLSVQAGDKFYVIGETAFVRVEGEVQFPGPFPLMEGLRLKALLRHAELLPEASVVQASLIRKVNFEGQTEDDPALDRLRDIDRTQRTDAEEALITLKTQQLSGRLPIDFAALMAGDDRHNILLQDGDVVRIPRFVPSVRVTGAVIAPANIPYNPTLTVGEYIDLAGGFNTRAKRKDIILVEGNTGNPIRVKATSPVRPGDAIVVPTQESTPGQGYRIARETIAMLGSVASLILTIFLINRERGQ